MQLIQRPTVYGRESCISLFHRLSRKAGYKN